MYDKQRDLSRAEELMQQNDPEFQKAEQKERHAEIAEQEEQAARDRLNIIRAANPRQ